MNLLRRNALANMAGRVATALLWLAVTPFVLARLGVQGFGIWSLFFAFNSYLIALDLGLGPTMARFIAAARPSGNRRVLTQTLRRGLWLAVGLGLLWSGLVVLSRGWMANAFHVPAAMVAETLDALFLFGVAALLMFPAQTLMASLQGFERLDLSNLCLVLGVTAHVLALYLGLSAGGGLRAAAVAGIVGQMVTGLTAVGLLRGRLREISPDGQGNGPSWRDLLHFGAALQMLGLLFVIQFQSGRILLGLLGNLSMVAENELAFRVANGVAGIPVLILGAVMPAASRAWKSEGLAAVSPLFTSTSRWLYTQSVIALGLVWLLAPDLTRVWLGPGHERIAPLIRLWAVAYAVHFSTGPGTSIARGIGMPWLEVWSLVAAALTNIALALWWVPRYGTVGAVAAVGVSFVAAFVTFVAVFHRRSGIPFGPWFGRELVPRAVAGSLAVGLSAWLLAGPLAAHLPPPGWTHGAAATLLFVAFFTLFFTPLGDTQRLSRALWQMAAGVWAPRHDVRV